MATIKSSTEHLTLNADGSGKDIKFQANGVEVSSISSAGVMTATSFAGDGSALTGVGKVLQVVQGTTSTEVSNSTTTFTDTGLTATITPTSTTSKILVIVHQNGGYKSNGHASNSIYTTLLRDATVISSLSRYAGNTGTTITHYIESISTSYLDSPATTTATTYKTQYRNHTASAVVAFQVGGTPTSTITLMEIGA